jgi:uncharacterized protein (DUF2062 family)
MPRRLLRRYLPDHRRIREHRHLQFFGDRLHDPNLWHLNRRSVAGAMGVGVFVALLPTLGQMAVAAAAAIWLRVNLPLAVAMVWITNPLTMPPIFFFNYKIGAWLLGVPPTNLHVEMSFEWFLRETNTVLLPLLIGSLVMGVLLSVLVYFSVRMVWRLYVIRKRRSRLGASP